MTLTATQKKQIINAVPFKELLVNSCRWELKVDGVKVGYCGAKKTGRDYCDFHNEINCPALGELSLSKSREAALRCVQSLGAMKCTQVYFEKLTDVDYGHFDNFAHGATCPQPETLIKYKNATKAMLQMRRGIFTAMNVFERFYLHEEDTKAIADRLQVAEYIVVKLMNMNDELRFKVKARKEGQVA